MHEVVRGILAGPLHAVEGCAGIQCAANDADVLGCDLIELDLAGEAPILADRVNVVEHRVSVLAKVGK